MKTLLIILFSIISSYSFSQEISIKEILEKSDKCIRQINTISYWIDYETKYLSDEDTTARRAICHLKYVPEDSLKVHHNRINISGSHQQVYNGNNILGRF